MKVHNKIGLSSLAVNGSLSTIAYSLLSKKINTLGGKISYIALVSLTTLFVSNRASIEKRYGLRHRFFSATPMMSFY